jgi:hypothetical protein
MNNRPKSPKQQNHDRKQQRKTLASEIKESYAREQLAPAAAQTRVSPPQTPQARAPQASAPQAQAPQARAPHAPAPQAQVSQPAPPVRASVAASKEPPALLAKPQRHLLESAVDTMERSLKAAGQGTVAVNRKLIDIARANVASGLDLALDLATAKNPIEMARVQMAFWDEQMKALASQAQELRTLSAEMVAQASEPIREHVKRS